MSEIDYKLAFQKLQIRYPKIAKEIADSDPIVDNFKMWDIFWLFCDVKGVTYQEIAKGENNHAREILLAVLVVFFDPDYFKFNKALKRGLRNKLAILTGIRDQTQISHILGSVKIFMKAYADFRSEVEYIHRAIKREIDEKQ